MRGTGSLHELCPAEAVTGQYAASALRAAAEGRWGHQVWCDVSPQVAPEHRGGPKVDPSAYVDPQAFVAPDVVVGPNAYVGGGAVLLAGTRVSEGARVDDRAVVGPHTDLGDRVWVGSHAHVRSARVGAGSVIEDTDIALGADPSANSVVVARRIVGDFGDGVNVVPRPLPAAEIPQRSAEGDHDYDRLLEPFPGALVMLGARVAETAFLAPGSVVCPGAVVGPDTHLELGVVVGSGALVRKGASAWRPRADDRRRGRHRRLERGACAGRGRGREGRGVHRPPARSGRGHLVQRAAAGHAAPPRRSAGAAAHLAVGALAAFPVGRRPVLGRAGAHRRAPRPLGASDRVGAAQRGPLAEDAGRSWCSRRQGRDHARRHRDSRRRRRRRPVRTALGDRRARRAGRRGLLAAQRHVVRSHADDVGPGYCRRRLQDGGFERRSRRDRRRSVPDAGGAGALGGRDRQPRAVGCRIVGGRDGARRLARPSGARRPRSTAGPSSGRAPGCARARMWGRWPKSARRPRSAPARAWARARGSPTERVCRSGRRRPPRLRWARWPPALPPPPRHATAPGSGSVFGSLSLPPGAC